MPSPPRSATRAPSGGRSSSSGEFGVASDAAESRSVARAGARARAARRGRGLRGDRRLLARRRPLGPRAICRQAEELVDESIELFRALAGSPERIPSPVNIAEIRMQRPRGRPGLGIVFEDTLQPFVEISCDAAVSYVLANQAGIARARGDLARARALLDESAARFEAAGDERGPGGGARPARLPRARRGGRCRQRTALSSRRSSCAPGRATGAGAGSCSSGLGLIDTTPATTRAPSAIWPRLASIFRRAGDRWGLASALWRTADLAFARGRRRRCGGGAAGGARGARGDAAGALDREHARRARRGGGAARRRRAAAALLADARERYAARDDALGVADVEERLERALLRGR